MGTIRKTRHRLQAMVDEKIQERVKAEAEKNGISISAMTALLIRRGLDSACL